MTGWKLMPPEPTMDMYLAFGERQAEGVGFAESYRAMYDAAPPAPATTQGEASAAVEEAARRVLLHPVLLDALEPDLLEAIADEIDDFRHSARAASLRGIAKRQRAAIAKAKGEEA